MKKLTTAHKTLLGNAIRRIEKDKTLYICDTLRWPKTGCDGEESLDGTYLAREISKFYGFQYGDAWVSKSYYNLELDYDPEGYNNYFKAVMSGEAQNFRILLIMLFMEVHK